MDDPLDLEIQKTREERAEAKTQADKWLRKEELLAARLMALEEAAQLRPGQYNQSFQRSLRLHGSLHKGGKGRQPGAISHPWRKTLLAIRREAPDGATEEHIATIAAREPELKNIRPRDVRARMESYTTHRYVEATPAGWRVTDVVGSKFGSTEVDARQPEQSAADPLEESAA